MSLMNQFSYFNKFHY